MKRYIKRGVAASHTPKRKTILCSSNGRYIGGKLFDLPESYWDDEDDTARIERTEEQDSYIHNFSDNYIVYWDNGDSISVNTDLNISWDIIERMAIKEGIDVIAYPDHIDVIGYYGRNQDVAHLYPISDDKAAELVDLVDNSDFDETTTLESYISEYAWNGASDIDIIKSWR